MLRVIYPLFIATLLLVKPVQAHPHVWVGTTVGFVVFEGRITGVRLDWAFDEFFSELLFEDYDANRNRKFEPAEVRALENKAFAHTGEQNWFTYIRIGGKVLTGLKPQDFSVEVRKKEVVYHFLLPLPEPVDPRKVPVSVDYYENSYYVEMLPPKTDPVLFTGDGSLSCRYKIDEDKSILFYFNSVSPMRVSLSC